MDTDDDLFLDLIETVTLNLLARIGNDPRARHMFYRRFLALAQVVVGQANRGGSATRVRLQPP